MMIDPIEYYAEREGGDWIHVPPDINGILVDTSSDITGWEGIAAAFRTERIFAIKTVSGYTSDRVVGWRHLNHIPKITVKRVSTEMNSVLKERGSRYGAFSSHASITQLLKDCMKGKINCHGATFGTNWDKLNDSQKEALEMIAHKIGRILNGDPNYDDSWVDIAGYAQLIVDQLQGKNT